ncbi:espin-like isoform X1 [Argopecten irradians]|uniref:espin-like isoform X1 n=1 Tax=Argopecten irradians TaxID=31199 RepID=UPI00371CF32D
MTNDRIFEAAKQGDLTYLQSVSSSFDENTCDENGANCLHYAVRGGRLDVVEYLIKKRNFNAKKRTRVGSTTAHDAAATGKTSVLQWLLKHGNCTVNDQDGTGATVTHLAARYGHGRLIEWLMDETDADIMLKSASGALPIHFAVSGGNQDVVEIIVKETPRTVNLQMINGVTPVYVACQGGHLDILKFLVQKGGSIKMKAFDGMSGLHAAAQLGKLECIKWLVKDQKCNPNDRDFDGASPLHFAASRGHYKVIEWLMKEGGARVTLDNLGGSPLHNAGEMGQLQCVRTLLANGCSADITDNNGLTAADLADKCYHTECANEIKAQIDHEAGAVELFSFNTSQSSLTSTGPGDPLTLRLGFQDSDFSPVTRSTTTHRKTESLEVFFDAESDNEYSSSIDFLANPDPHFQSQETGECESSICLSDKSHESSECESLLRRQLLQPDFELSPPFKSDAQCQTSDQSDISSVPPLYRATSEYSWNSLRRRSISDLSSPLQNGRDSDAISISSSVSSVSQSASQPEGSVVSVSSLRPPSVVSFAITHQEELFKAIRARRMETEVNISSNNLVISEKTENVESNDTKESSESHRLSDSLESGAGSVLPTDCTHPTPPPPVPPPPPPPLPASAPPPINQALLNGILQRFERPNSLSMEKSEESSTVSSPPSSVTSPMIPGPVKHDLIAELKVAAASGNSNLRKTRKPREDGRMTCIYSFGGPNEKVNSQVSNGSKSNGQSNGTASGQVTDNGQHEANSESNMSNGQTEPKKTQPPSEKSMVIIESTPPKTVSTPQNPSKGSVPSKASNEVTTSSSKKTSNGINSASKPSNGIAPLKTTNGVISSKTPNGTTSGAETVKGTDTTNGTDPFDPKNFLDKVDQTVPDWKKHMLARKMAEAAKKQAEEQKKIEAEENKYKHLPAWKRQLMEKRDAEAKAEEAKKREQQASQAKTMPVINTHPAGKLAPWQLEMKTKKL